MLRVISDRVENPGYLGSGDGKDVSQLLVDIRAAVTPSQTTNEHENSLKFLMPDADFVDSLNASMPPILLRFLIHVAFWTDTDR